LGGLTTKSFRAVLCSGLSKEGFFSLGATAGGGVAWLVVTMTSDVDTSVLGSDPPLSSPVDDMAKEWARGVLLSLSGRAGDRQTVSSARPGTT